jgi:choline-sulfatase
MARQPNVIYVLSDQLRAFEVGCYRNQVIDTPHMDRFASEGARFHTACSNAPVCTPARSILLTGQYARSCTGALGNVAGTPPADERVRLTDTTMAEALRDEGYHTALIGKWHIHPRPFLTGFDETLYPHHSHRYTHQTYFNTAGDEFVVDEFTPLREAEQARQFLQRQKKDEPFFLYYSISPPHMPLADAPPKYAERYAAEDIPLRPNVWKGSEMAYDEKWFRIYLWDYLYYREQQPHTTKPLPEGFDLRDLTALYYGLVTCVDDCLGVLMNTLRETGLDEDTLVVFTSDHGDNLGSHQAFNKGLLIEESIRIPLMFRWPGGIEPSVSTQQTASLVDVMPTTLSLAGFDTPGSVQGTDLAPIVRGEAATVGENCAYIEGTHGDIGVRTPRHTYGIHRADGVYGGPDSEIIDDRYLFYDNKEDPFQSTNLIQTDAQLDLGEELRQKVLTWNEATPWLDAPPEEPQ